MNTFAIPIPVQSPQDLAAPLLDLLRSTETISDIHDATSEPLPWLAFLIDQVEVVASFTPDGFRLHDPWYRDFLVLALDDFTVDRVAACLASLV